MRTLFAILLVACSGDDEGPVPVDDDACGLYAADIWSLINAGPSAEEATAILLERPYQVSVPAEQVSFLLADAVEAGPITVLTDQEGTITSLASNGGALELPRLQPSRRCPEGLPEAYTVEVEPGPVLIGLGPVFQANVWLYVGAGELLP